MISQQRLSIGGVNDGGIAADQPIQSAVAEGLRLPVCARSERRVAGFRPMENDRTTPADQLVSRCVLTESGPADDFVATPSTRRLLEMSTFAVFGRFLRRPLPDHV